MKSKLPTLERVSVVEAGKQLLPKPAAFLEMTMPLFYGKGQNDLKLVTA